MKHLFLFSFILLMIANLAAQGSFDLTGKIFQQVDNIPNSTTDLKFNSNTQVLIIITNQMNGKTYVDECPGKATVQGNKITIYCTCEDREIYPDPIRDSYTYDQKSQVLTSTSYRSAVGKYFIWKLKQ